MVSSNYCDCFVLTNGLFVVVIKQCESYSKLALCFLSTSKRALSGLFSPNQVKQYDTLRTSKPEIAAFGELKIIIRSPPPGRRVITRSLLSNG